MMRIDLFYGGTVEDPDMVINITYAGDSIVLVSGYNRRSDEGTRIHPYYFGDAVEAKTRMITGANVLVEKGWCVA